MKIRCEVTAVKTNGEYLSVKMKGLPPNAAEWRWRELQEITVPANKITQSTFYVGRSVDVIVKPR